MGDLYPYQFEGVVDAFASLKEWATEAGRHQVTAFLEELRDQAPDNTYKRGALDDCAITCREQQELHPEVIGRRWEPPGDFDPGFDLEPILQLCWGNQVNGESAGHEEQMDALVDWHADVSEDEVDEDGTYGGEEYGYDGWIGWAIHQVSVRFAVPNPYAEAAE